jgi:hypothetical protein
MPAAMTKGILLKCTTRGQGFGLPCQQTRQALMLHKAYSENGDFESLLNYLLLYDNL